MHGAREIAVLLESTQRFGQHPLRDVADGVPANGKRLSVMTINFHTVVDGRLAGAYDVGDWAGAVRQRAGKWRGAE